MSHIIDSNSNHSDLSDVIAKFDALNFDLKPLHAHLRPSQARASNDMCGLQIKIAGLKWQ